MTPRAEADSSGHAMDGILDFLAAREGGRIALLSHPRPDGDALGSILGLAEILRGAGFRAMAVNAMPVPAKLGFLLSPDNIRQYQTGDWYREYDCVGVLDCGETERLEPINREAVQALPTFTIDHHASSQGIGQAVWRDPAASSTGEMAVRLRHRAGWPLTPAAAEALWVAIVTDTGRFSFENTSEAALWAGMACLAAGANPARAAEAIYQSVSVAERRLQADFLGRLELHADGRLALAWLTADDFRRAGAGIEASQDMVNLLRDIVGVEVALFLYEIPTRSPNAPPSVKISIRTLSPHNALDLAVPLRGGGHMRAAGCSVPAAMDEARRMILGLALGAFFATE